MANSLNHQKTIGIVGSNPDAHEFILEANRLGFITYQLCQTEEEAVSSFGADKEFFGAFDDERIQEDFLMHCDLLVYFDYSLNSRQIEEARKTVVIPQGDDLLSISRDRALQKAFKESLSVNIAPYETILTSEDIKEGLRSIGYPAVLRTNYLTSSNKDQSFFIYDEEDIEEASKLLKYGTCVLESWIVTDEELSISLVKTASGAIETYPVVKKSYRNDRLSNVQTTAAIDQDLLEEIERVSRILAEGIQFIGAITIDFVVSPAQALYVGNIYPFPNELSRYSQKTGSMSIVEAHLRAITSLPLSYEMKEDSIYVPFYEDQIEAIERVLMIYPNWRFTFYPIVKSETKKTKEAIGHMIIETKEMEKILAILAENDL